MLNVVNFLLLAEPITLIYQTGLLLFLLISSGLVPHHQEKLTANKAQQLQSLIVNGTFRLHHSHLAMASQSYNLLLL